MRKTVIAVLATLALCAGTAAVAAAPASAGSARATIAGSIPSWATPANRVSAERGSDLMAFRVYLNQRNRSQLDATARAVSDPKSSSYRQYLSTAQMKARFDPTDAAVASVKSWLTSQGLTPGAVPANNLYVAATGTVAQVSKAFGVDLGVYAVKGHHLRAPDRLLTIPSSLAGTVQSVVGTDQAQDLLTPDHIAADSATTASASASAAASPAGTIPSPPGFRNAKPCSAYWAEQISSGLPPYKGYPGPLPYAPCGYTPPQLRSAYGIQSLVDAGHDGTGSHGGRGRRVPLDHPLLGRGDLRLEERPDPPLRPPAAQPGDLPGEQPVGQPGPVRRQRLVR